MSVEKFSREQRGTLDDCMQNRIAELKLRLKINEKVRGVETEENGKEKRRNKRLIARLRTENEAVCGQLARGLRQEALLHCVLTQHPHKFLKYKNSSLQEALREEFYTAKQIENDLNLLKHQWKEKQMKIVQYKDAWTELHRLYYITEGDVGRSNAEVSGVDIQLASVDRQRRDADSLNLTYTRLLAKLKQENMLISDKLNRFEEVIAGQELEIGRLRNFRSEAESLCREKLVQLKDTDIAYHQKRHERDSAVQLVKKSMNSAAMPQAKMMRHFKTSSDSDSVGGSIMDGVSTTNSIRQMAEETRQLENQLGCLQQALYVSDVQQIVPKFEEQQDRALQLNQKLEELKDIHKEVSTTKQKLEQKLHKTVHSGRAKQKKYEQNIATLEEELEFEQTRRRLTQERLDEVGDMITGSWSHLGLLWRLLEAYHGSSDLPATSTELGDTPLTELLSRLGDCINKLQETVGPAQSRSWWGALQDWKYQALLEESQLDRARVILPQDTSSTTDSVGLGWMEGTNENLVTREYLKDQEKAFLRRAIRKRPVAI